MDAITNLAATMASDEAVFDRAVYADAELYEAEQRRIFGRCWQFVGHESQVPNPGDFVQSRMGEERVLLTRGLDSEIHVLVNSCSHRGTELCAVERGNAPVLTCPYHAWSFSLDGSLHRIPFAETLGANIDRNAWGLATATAVETYKGLVFATFDPEAGPLADSLGDARYYLDMMVDRREGRMVVIGTQRWRHRGNWKLPVESATGDFYHVKVAHASAAHASPAIAASVGSMSDDSSAKNVAVPGGHGFNIVVQADDCSLDPRLPVLRRALEEPVLAEYFRRLQPEADERLGAQRARMTVNLGAIFPNLIVLPLSFSIRMCFPDGPDRSETWMWILGYEDMSDSVRASFVRGYLAGIGPDSLLEPDDMAVWAGIARGVKSRQAEHRPLFAGLGIDRERTGPNGAPGRWGHPMSEIGMRNYYREWSRAWRPAELTMHDTTPLPRSEYLLEVGADEHLAIQRFLYRESQLLDERRLDEWLDLFDDEVDYIVVYPTSPSATSVPDHRPAHHFLDRGELPLTVLTKQTMTLRVRRLRSGRALDDEPPAPTVRLVTNVDAVRLGSTEWLSVRSAFVLSRDFEGQQILTGTRRDTLVSHGATFRIVRRVVEVNTRSYPSNLIFV